MAVKKKKAAKKKVAKKKVAKKAVKKKAAKKKAAKKAVKKKAVGKRPAKVTRKGMKAIRYPLSKKKQVVTFVQKVNQKNGKGGIAAAVRKYKVSALTITRWLKKLA